MVRWHVHHGRQSRGEWGHSVSKLFDEPMTVAQRFLLTLIVVIVILLALAAVGFFTGNWDENEVARPGYGLMGAETRPELCMDDETRERVRKIMLEALDNALRDKIEKLYEVWLSDPTGQPMRAARGSDAAIRAYHQARGAAMKFNPPECSG